jgi:2-phospho-L-lactate transferase/gluconeogenesis factor (CofD/UPF0052 family)
VRSLEDPTPVSPSAAQEIRSLIREADLICFPTGSFYSSVLANLLPRGVGRAIADARCPKIYIPNMGEDPEQLGMTLGDSVQRILEAVRADAGEETPVDQIVNLVAIDSNAGTYQMPLDTSRVKEFGVELMDLDLVQSSRWPLIDASALAESLLSLA